MACILFKDYFQHIFGSVWENADRSRSGMKFFTYFWAYCSLYIMGVRWYLFSELHFSFNNQFQLHVDWFWLTLIQILIISVYWRKYPDFHEKHKALYIKSKLPFPEVEKFIQISRDRYVAFFSWLCAIVCKLWLLLVIQIINKSWENIIHNL